MGRLWRGLRGVKRKPCRCAEHQIGRTRWSYRERVINILLDRLRSIHAKPYCYSETSMDD